VRPVSWSSFARALSATVSPADDDADPPRAVLEVQHAGGSGVGGVERARGGTEGAGTDGECHGMFSGRRECGQSSAGAGGRSSSVPTRWLK
jgi:hypothetical protein